MDRDDIKKHITFWHIILWVLLCFALFLSYKYFLDTTSTKSKWTGLFAGSISILFATYKWLVNSFINIKDEIYDKIARYFFDGAFCYFRQILKITLLVVTFICAILIKPMGIGFVVCFASGSFFALLSIILSLFIVSKASFDFLKCRNELISTMENQAFNYSCVVSFAMMAFAIVPFVILFHLTKDFQVVNGFAFGVVLIAMVNTISYGILSQSSKNAHDIVCNQISKFSKDDKRNPLLLLNGLGNNILKSSVTTCDFFAIFSMIIVGAMTLGDQFSLLMGSFFPIPLLSCVIFATIIATLIVGYLKLNNSKIKFSLLLFLTNMFFILMAFVLIKNWFPSYLDLIIPLVIGIVGISVFCVVHLNYDLFANRSQTNVINASICGFEQTLRQVLKEGFGGVLLPSIFLGICIIFSFILVRGVDEPSVGLYGIALLAIGMLASFGVFHLLAIFSQITNTSDSIVDFYKEKMNLRKQNLREVFEEINEKNDLITKNYTNLVSFFAVVLVLIAYTLLAELIEIDIINPFVMSALFIGVIIPFLFISFVLRGCIKVGKRMVLEVEKQIKITPQILRYEILPDYENSIKVCAINSSVATLLSCFVIFIIFFIVAKKLYLDALFGFAFGCVLSSFGLMFLVDALGNIAQGAQKYFISQCGSKQNDEFDSIYSNRIIFSSYEKLLVPILKVLIKFIATLTLALIPLFV